MFKMESFGAASVLGTTVGVLLFVQTGFAKEEVADSCSFDDVQSALLYGDKLD